MATSDPNEKPPVPFSEETIQEWIDEVKKWSWEDIHDDPPIFYYGKEGPCPRCKDHISHVYSNAPRTLGEKTAAFSEARMDNGTPPTVYFWCNCTVAHPPHAAGDGCGQHARIPSWSPISELLP